MSEIGRYDDWRDRKRKESYEEKVGDYVIEEKKMYEWIKTLLITLITVQCCKDEDSQARGAMSLLGTPEGTLSATVNERAVHTTTMKGTP